MFKGGKKCDSPGGWRERVHGEGGEGCQRWIDPLRMVDHVKMISGGRVRNTLQVRAGLRKKPVYASTFMERSAKSMEGSSKTRAPFEILWEQARGSTHKAPKRPETLTAHSSTFREKKEKQREFICNSKNAAGVCRGVNHSKLCARGGDKVAAREAGATNEEES